jgi:hypothetical protein
MGKCWWENWTRALRVKDFAVKKDGSTHVAMSFRVENLRNEGNLIDKMKIFCNKEDLPEYRVLDSVGSIILRQGVFPKSIAINANEVRDISLATNIPRDTPMPCCIAVEFSDKSGKKYREDVTFNRTRS